MKYSNKAVGVLVASFNFCQLYSFPAMKRRNPSKLALASKQLRRSSRTAMLRLSSTELQSGSGDEGAKNEKKEAVSTDAEKGWITDRTPLSKLWCGNDNVEERFKIISWNVNGLRALIRKDPLALSKLVVSQNFPDVLCLQETKLQTIHVEDEKLGMKEILRDEGYVSYFSCSTAKKGYSGTAVFVKKDIRPSNDSTTVSIDYGIGKPEHEDEGRSIVVHFPKFSLGQNLKRLQYRIQWDLDLLNFMKKIEKRRGVPVLWLGDLNVAHKRLDVYNYGAKHLLKQAGCTLEERESFSKQLEAGFVDIFRCLHPDAQGHYTYWSTRTRAREPNRGLRLDYFVGSSNLLGDHCNVTVKDSYMLPDQDGSDHCPIVLEMEVS